ncbi:MAG: hypothetical protein SGILL_008467, partial [Bacillariaceae sp.]
GQSGEGSKYHGKRFEDKVKPLSETVCFVDGEFKRAADANLEVSATRVGNLTVTRCFGDFDMKSNPGVSFEKQGIIALPDILISERNLEKAEFLGLFTDGVMFEYEKEVNCDSHTWGPPTRTVKYSERYGEHVAERILKRDPTSLKGVADSLHWTARRKRGHEDNEGMILVQLPAQPQSLTATDTEKDDDATSAKKLKANETES